jgi:hypothetical protein
MTNKDSIIVTYVPNKMHLINQFRGLYYSVVHKTDLYKKFDFLVAGPREIRNLIPKEHCVFVEVEDLSLSNDFRYRYSNGPYAYVNSFIPFVNLDCIKVILQYEYSLRLDVDTFLCPGITDIKCASNEVIVGNAGYSSETARVRLPEITKKLGLSDQNTHNIGSTWFCPSPHAIRVGSRTVEYVKYFLENHFSEHEGKWPQWYGGVILLYSGHVAVNSSGLKITKNNRLDFYSTSEKLVTDYYTLHCWHTDNFFSKHWYMSNRYRDRKPNSDSLKCNEYSYDCIKGGEKL